MLLQYLSNSDLVILRKLQQQKLSAEDAYQQLSFPTLIRLAEIYKPLAKECFEHNEDWLNIFDVLVEAGTSALKSQGSLHNFDLARGIFLYHESLLARAKNHEQKAECYLNLALSYGNLPAIVTKTNRIRSRLQACYNSTHEQSMTQNELNWLMKLCHVATYHYGSVAFVIQAKCYIDITLYNLRYHPDCVDASIRLTFASILAAKRCLPYCKTETANARSLLSEFDLTPYEFCFDEDEINALCKWLRKQPVLQEDYESMIQEQHLATQQLAHFHGYAAQSAMNPTNVITDASRHQLKR